MKNLLLFLLILAAAVLYFHDKQQTADLVKAQADNAQLTQQLADKDTAFNQLQARMQQLGMQYQSESRLSRPVAPAAATPNSGALGLQGSALDRGAYKDGH